MSRKLWFLVNISNSDTKREEKLNDNENLITACLSYAMYNNTRFNIRRKIIFGGNYWILSC